MHIQIPDDQYDTLTVAAHAAGYVDVPAFITALAQKVARDPRGTISAEERQASLAECDESMAEFDAGGGRDAEEAFLEIGRKRGFDLSE